MTWQDEAQALLRELFKVGVSRADPAKAVSSNLAQRPTLKPQEGGKLWILAFGKAARSMAQAALVALPSERLGGPALVVTNEENYAELDGALVMQAEHPLPGPQGEAAAERLLGCAAGMKEGDLALVLVSGGASAMLPAPVVGVSLADKIATTDRLLACGADITEINCVRKHLSRIKGGGLLKACAPARVLSLILSDVVGDNLSAIASGPTVPDDTSFPDAMEILERYGILGDLPAGVQRHLLSGLKGKALETLKKTDAAAALGVAELIGGNQQSLEAIAQSAAARGLEVQRLNEAIVGEAREAARHLVDLLSQAKASRRKVLILGGGETTVTLKGKGKGGRNQEMALAFALAAEAAELPEKWLFLSAGSDGRDGPTDAAGGFADPQTLQRIRAAGANPSALLGENDAYRALSLSGNLLISGGTGTNVGDFQLLLVENSFSSKL